MLRLSRLQILVMKLGLRDVEYFAAIAEHANRRAAEALGLSQPALSRSLGRLETSMRAKARDANAEGRRAHRCRFGTVRPRASPAPGCDDVLLEATELSRGIAESCVSAWARLRL